MINVKLKRMDYLRAIYALSIVLCHYCSYFSASIFSFGRAFSIAIYAFFILSGFSIFYFHEEDETSLKIMGQFLCKRFKKIYPVYWVYIALTLFLDYIFDGRILTYHSKTLVDILKSAACFPPGVFADYPSCLIPPAWFLSYVVFFYIVYAIVRYVFGTKVFMCVARVWLLVSLFFSLGGNIEGTWWNFLFSPFNVSILLGCEIACVVKRNACADFVKEHQYLLWIFLLIAILNWLLTGKYIDTLPYNNNMRVFGYTLVYGLIILWLLFAEYRLPAGVKFFDPIKNILRYINQASYSIYLTHFIVLEVLMIDFGLTEKIWLMYKATIPLLLVGIGCLCYQLIEKNVIRLLKK